MPFVEEDVKLQTEHEKGVLKSVWALCCWTLLSCAAKPCFLGIMTAKIAV